MAGPHRRRTQTLSATRRIQVCLTEQEYQQIRAAAGRPGRGLSLSRFVAEAALTAAGAAGAATGPPSFAHGRRRAPSLLVLAEVADAAAEVSRVGNNLNQLARERNTTGRRPDGTDEAVQRAVAALQRLADVAEG